MPIVFSLLVCFLAIETLVWALLSGWKPFAKPLDGTETIDDGIYANEDLRLRLSKRLKNALVLTGVLLAFVVIDSLAQTAYAAALLGTASREALGYRGFRSSNRPWRFRSPHLRRTRGQSRRQELRYSAEARRRYCRDRGRRAVDGHAGCGLLRDRLETCHADRPASRLDRISEADRCAATGGDAENRRRMDDRSAGRTLTSAERADPPYAGPGTKRIVVNSSAQRLAGEFQ